MAGTDEPSAAAEQPATRQSPPVVGRRRLFGLLGAAGVTGVALGGSAGAGITASRLAPEAAPAAAQPSSAPAPAAADPRRQPGVATPLPAQLRMLAFDLDPAVADRRDRRALATVLTGWRRLAERLRAGELAREAEALPMAGLPTENATLTIGFGPSLLTRLGLDAQRPEALADLPVFPGDQLDPARCGGDVLVQVCAEDELVASGVADLVRRQAAGVLRPRWSQNGFRALNAAPQPNPPARNLMGQVDGINNPQPGSGLFDTTVWVPEWERPQWMVNGTYLVVRRIRMLLDEWYALPVDRRDEVIGRHTGSGAPLGRQSLTDQIDLVAKRPDGQPHIPRDAHVRVSNPSTNGGARMFRRPFNYDDGARPDGTRDAGLLFLAFQADPRRGFVPVMRSMATGGDALNRFIVHEASALFAIPPAGDGYVGQPLLEG
ncbi:Dyp-type peroxidase [Streptoalloteichus hindustanus]|uniref:Dye decolorizing peroxidase n=1 Tax=Streptoalloteichus hindustanus TaxID=2017 RepID=A0A1M5K1H4_STRHI|nr:Dyp-type peroxidase [Streptoalloteichus hindustanus]SHG46626.1 dye decolorizing peroxidase [Streptoalloteichus hindustanus]